MTLSSRNPEIATRIIDTHRIEISTADPTLRPLSQTLFPLTLAVFVAYLIIAAPLAVIPLYVHNELGLNNFWVGVAVGIQFLATVLTRHYAGQLSDRKGAKLTTLSGLCALCVAGMVYIIVFFLPSAPSIKFGVLVVARLIQGFGESLLISGNVAWGLGLVGQARAGKMLSWTGLAIFGALAVGAPVGLWFYQQFGFSSLALAVLTMPMLAMAINFRAPAITPHAGIHPPFRQVMAVVWPSGLALAMQGVGFAVIGTFAALYFQAQHWPHVAYALSFFGLAFVLVRVLFGHLTDKVSGYKLASISFMVEIVGLMIFFVAPSKEVAWLGTALTGAGCSLIFPALGVELIKRTPPHIRGTAMGNYAAFQDISYVLTAPLAGLVVSSLGYASVYGIAAVLACIGLIVVLVLHRKSLSTG